MVEEEKDDSESGKEEDAIAWEDFLTNSPPGSTKKVVSFVSFDFHSSPPRASLATPDLYLHCNRESCDGSRYFAYKGSGVTIYQNEIEYEILHYVCKNCESTKKTFALLLVADKNGFSTSKIGEWPPFGSPTPARVIKLIGPDKELFLKGRRAETQGLGIGAFAYYRRVVENQKNRLIDQIIDVSERIGAPTETINLLEEAKKETQFSTAVEKIKDALPESLKVNGHNPLTLLHDALSQGLHNDSELECLELAKSIRVVLTDLAERIGFALEEKKELNQAVSKLLNKQRTKKENKK
jgi:hypothetical protein